MIVGALFLIAGIVNLMPMAGVLTETRLQDLYGVPLDDPNLLILMRHRAFLFAIVGMLLCVAAFHVPLRPFALAAGLLSMLSFVVIAYGVGDYNADLGRVVLVDWAASALLVVAAILGYLERTRGGA